MSGNTWAPSRISISAGNSLKSFANTFNDKMFIISLLFSTLHRIYLLFSDVAIFMHTNFIAIRDSKMDLIKHIKIGSFEDVKTIVSKDFKFHIGRNTESNKLS